MFVVFYGLGTDPVHNVPYLEHWRAIAQHDLAVGEPVLVGETVFIVEKHPTAHDTAANSYERLDQGDIFHTLARELHAQRFADAVRARGDS